jgi:hypothetical protein
VLIDEHVTVDVSVGSVLSPRIDLELLAPAERASIDVVLVGVRPGVLLPGEEVVSSNRLELADSRPTEKWVGGRGPRLRGRRRLDRQDDEEGTQERYQAFSALR